MCPECKVFDCRPWKCCCFLRLKCAHQKEWNCVYRNDGGDLWLGFFIASARLSLLAHHIYSVDLTINDLIVHRLAGSKKQPPHGMNEKINIINNSSNELASICVQSVFIKEHTCIHFIRDMRSRTDSSHGWERNVPFTLLNVYYTFDFTRMECLFSLSFFLCARNRRRRNRKSI